MSYRAFKHLLGETSLERKCRFLLGGVALLLITASFWWYARQTEGLAHDQTRTTGRLLAAGIIDKVPGHIRNDAWLKTGLNYQDKIEKDWLKSLSHYDYSFIKLWPKPNSNPGPNTVIVQEPGDRFERQLYEDFLADKTKFEDSRPIKVGDDQQFFVYYGAIRASTACLDCHRREVQSEAEKKDRGELQENGLIAVVKIRMDTKAVEEAVHLNRAILMGTAILTAWLIMIGSYVIVRYVVVKPVKHLKEVSDAISAGELNVRSEIQTGDEFEDLSHAFNRMLRNLVSMQDRLRKVNADLDHKVDELARANLALYESNRLKSDFLATMSHELRTPLNSILGFSEVLLSSEQLSDKPRRWVHNIQSSGERLLALINDILDLAKIEAGKMELRLETLAAADVCEGQLNMFRPLAQKKNIELRSQVEPNLPPLRQDQTKLQQILSNLLSNAIKFTPEGGRVLLKAEADPLHVILTVQDTGVGIAPEDQELVFERFRQAGNPMTREQGGTGLGLSIVRELSKLLGGEVTLRSELGRGSTFTVRLPLQLSEEPRLEFGRPREAIELVRPRRSEGNGEAETAKTGAEDPAVHDFML